MLNYASFTDTKDLILPICWLFWKETVPKKSRVLIEQVHFQGVPSPWNCFQLLSYL